jgi:hypothetical protein
LQVAVNFTTGALATYATDAVTGLRVTYFPQQTGGPFASSNLVVDESIVAAAAKTTLANRAMAVQYVWDDTDSALDALEPVGEAPSATHTVAIDIVNGSSATDIDFHGDDEGNTVKVTYLKYSGFKAGSQINDTDISAASYNFTESVHYRGLVVPGYGCVVVGETGAAANLEIKIAGPSRAAADNISQWDPHLNKISTAQTTPAALATFATPWFIVEQETETRSFTGGTAAAQTFTGSATTAAAMSEIDGVAVASQTLYLRVIGT